MLEHAHAGDAVEGAVLHVAVVLQADLNAVLQARALHALGGQVELVLRQRDAHALRAELLRRAQHQRAPAAADVEQALARLQLDLAQDVVDLLHLRLVQCLVAVLEVGAGIDYVLVQPLAVEGVGDVVVVLDGLGIGLARVSEAALDAAHQAILGLGVVGQAVGRGQHVGQ